MVTDPRDAEREARVLDNLAAIEAHLLECSDIAARGKHAFFGPDFVYRYAAYAALVQLGNAVKDLPEAFRAAHTEADWRALMYTRDKVGHIYGANIDWDVIWETLINDVPADLRGVVRARESL